MPDPIVENSSKVIENLKRSSRDEYQGDYDSTVLSIYQMYVESADRVSQRRQTANSFYLTINTLFLGGFAILSDENVAVFQVLLAAVAGIALCAFWLRNIESYKDLNSGKFSVINAIEEFLPIAVYETEWKILERGENRKKYKPFHTVEVSVPIIFIIVYVAIFIYHTFELDYLIKKISSFVCS